MSRYIYFLLQDSLNSLFIFMVILYFCRRRREEEGLDQRAGLQEEDGDTQEADHQVLTDLGEVYTVGIGIQKMMAKRKQMIKMPMKKWKDKGKCMHLNFVTFKDL